MSIDQFLLSADTTDLNYPEIRPTLDLNFARVKTLDPRIDFTRASGGSYVGADGLIKYAGVNEARFDHDPETGESLGLLIEEARTNLITRSEEINLWGTSGANIVTKDQTGPDGIPNSAVSITDNDTRPDETRTDRNVPITPSTTTNYCLSVFAKRGSSPFFSFYAFFNGNSTRGSAIFYNFDTDTLTPFASDGGGIVPSILGRIKYPNGWYRIYFVVRDANNGLNTSLLFRLYTATRESGRTGSTIFFGAQMEIGAFPTSYIPTTASTVTRTADNVSMVGENFSSWYNQSEGSIYSNIAISRTLTNSNSGSWTLGGAARGYSLTHNINNSVRFFTRDDNTNQSSGDVNNLNTIGLKVCVNILPAVNNERIVCANNIFSGLTSYNVDVLVNRLLIGLNDIVGNPVNNYLNGHISQLTYFPKRLPNAQLQALTR
jgi:hypothetical protein